MSANQSNLSNFGYDIVIPTTQESINATLKYDLRHHNFLASKGYFIADENGKTAAISFDNLMIRTKGTDPLKIDSYKVDSSNQQAIANVVNSKLVYAFEAAIGIPPKLPRTSIPDIITLDPDGQSVSFSMICAQFTILAPNVTNTNEPYLKFSQPNNMPWIITFMVPLKTITDISNLPPDLKKKLDKLGPSFSVQQLILDISNAPTDASHAKISGLKTGDPVYELLTEFLNNNYLAELKSSWEPVFFYAFTNNTPGNKSSLILSNVKINFSRYSDPNNPKLNTLNYLCATNGDTLPQPKPFNWNWVEQPAQGDPPNGVMAINRNTFAKYLQKHLTPFIAANCLLPSVQVTAEGGGVRFGCGFTRGQAPTVTIPPNGAEVLQFTYHKSAIDGAGAGDRLGELSFATTCNASVTFSGNTIVVEQSLLLHVDLWSLHSNLTWDAIKKSIKDTFTLAVDQNGDLTATAGKPEQQDKSQTMPRVSGFTDWFTDINEIGDFVTDTIKNFLPTSLENLPLNLPQLFIFPGGNAFTFQKVEFSDHQDLITDITYVQPG